MGRPVVAIELTRTERAVLEGLASTRRTAIAQSAAALPP
jgi:hypothetical protein